MSAFTNPRPSLQLQQCAALMAQLMRNEGYFTATINDVTYSKGVLEVQGDRPVVGREHDGQMSGARFGVLEDEPDVEGLHSIVISGPAYVAACDRGAECPADEDHADDCPVGLFV